MMSSSSVDTGLGKGETGGITTMEGLPSDVVLDILSRVPVESVLDCKLVCKRLLRILRDQWNQFVKMHHEHQLQELVSHGDASSKTGLLFAFEYKTGMARLYYGDNYNSDMDTNEIFSHETLQKTGVSFPPSCDLEAIVGSCNGLICLCKHHKRVADPTHICNPNTGEYVNLPAYPCQNSIHYASAYGFGYVHSAATNYQYKVVRVYYPYLDDHFKAGEVQVYTIGSGTGWRTIGTTPYKLFRTSSLGLFANGALHWLFDDQIVAFNLADEKFRRIQRPPCFDSIHDSFHSLQVFGGNLCIGHQKYGERILDFWILKKNTNTTQTSWSRDLSIPYDSMEDVDEDTLLMPLLVTKKNEVLLADLYLLYCYDPKTTTIRKFWNIGKCLPTGINVSPHMNTFVSLAALGEKSEIKKGSE